MEIEHRTMRQSVGEEPMGSPVLVAGDHFGPRGNDDVELRGLASAGRKADRITRLAGENAELQGSLSLAQEGR